MTSLRYLALLLLLCPLSASAQQLVAFTPHAAGGGGGFLPSDLASLELWLDGSGTFYSDTGCSSSTTSGNVGCYPDASSNGRDALDSGATAPQYTTFGASAGVTLEDVDHLVFDTNNLSLTAFTIIAAVNFSADNTGRYISDDDGSGGLRLNDFSTFRVVWTAGANAATITTLSTGTDYVITATYDGSDVIVRANGTQIGTTSVSSKTLAVGRVGRPGNGDVGVPGDHGTVLIYSAAYSGSNLSDAECYVGDLHSITVSGC